MEEARNEMVFDFMTLLLDFLARINEDIIVSKAMGMNVRMIITSNIAANLIKNFLIQIPTAAESYLHNIPVISSESLSGLEFRLY